MTFGVHPLAKKISPAEYSIFVTMLMLTSLIPTMPLQMVFAQQTAGTLATNRGRQLALMIRWGWLLTFIVWGIIVLFVLVFQNRIMAGWGLAEPDDVVGDARGVADEFVDAAVFRRAARTAGFLLARLGLDSRRRRARRGGRSDCARVSWRERRG